MATSQEIAGIFESMATNFVPEKAEGVNAVIQFDLSGDSGGTYWVKIEDGKCTSGAGQAENPRMTIKASAEDYMNVATGKANVMQSFMMGKIKVQGDMGFAMKMAGMFGM
ncbi:MAG TPA: SCP2 sterol-binding domain-containing protein [Phototrophicaceae bacterium]|jgi:putative sterol carrier protein|nr:SCP2 sterol-binding domain-containing protein [Phototrophicaceae bacterium]